MDSSGLNHTEGANSTATKAQNRKEAHWLRILGKASTTQQQHSGAEGVMISVYLSELSGRLHPSSHHAEKSVSSRLAH